MRRVWLALLIASSGWGTAGVATRIVLDEGVGSHVVVTLGSSLAAVVVFLDERLQSGIVFGGLLIFAGVLVTDRAERRVRVRP